MGTINKAASDGGLNQAGSLPIRVALCAPGEIWGGVEQFVVTLASHFARTGVPVFVVAFHDGPLRERLENSGIPVQIINGRSRYDPTIVTALSRFLRQHQITILHSHGYKAAVAGSIAARLNGVAHVRTEHGSVEPWKGRARVKMELNAYAQRIATRWLTDATVFVSDDIRQRSRALLGGAEGLVIYNGIEPTGEPPPIPADARLDPGHFHLGIIGRVAPVKGHLYLLEAVSRLKHLKNLQLHVLGSGPLLEECRRRCVELEISHSVRFHGFRQNIRDYLRQLDLLVMPSIHEGLPYALLEAMYNRVPVIASKVGGLGEVIQDGVTGTLVPSGDIRALADAIERLHANGAVLAAMAENAARLVGDRFLVNDMAERYLDVYRAVANSAVPARPKT